MNVIFILHILVLNLIEISIQRLIYKTAIGVEPPFKFRIQGRAVVLVNFEESSPLHKSPRYRIWLYCADINWLDVKNSTHEHRMNYFKHYFPTLSDSVYLDYQDRRQSSGKMSLYCDRFQRVVFGVYVSDEKHGRMPKFRHVDDAEYSFVLHLTKGKTAGFLKFTYWSTFVIYSLKYNCLFNYYGEYCNIYCDSTVSDCGDPDILCKKGLTGLEQKINYHFNTDNFLTNEYLDKPEIETVWRTCDVVDHCINNPCQEHECLQYSETNYVCAHWLEPFLGNKERIFFRGDVVYCEIDIFHKLPSDVSFAIRIVENEFIMPNLESPTIGYIVARTGEAFATCEVSIATYNFNKTEKIQVVPHLKACLLDPSPKFMSETYPMTVDDAVTFKIPKSLNSLKIGMSLSYIYSPVSTNAPLNGNTLRFTEASHPGIYIISCMLYWKEDLVNVYLKSDYTFELKEKLRTPMPGQVVILQSTESFDCTDASFGSDVNTTALTDSSLPGIKTMGRFMHTSAHTCGTVNLTCLYKDKSELIHTKSYTIEILVPPSTLSIFPTVIALNMPIYCVTNAYPTDLIRTTWTIYQFSTEPIEVRKKVLFLNDFDIDTSGNKSITIKCLVRFSEGRINVSMNTSITSILNSNTMPFALIYKQVFHITVNKWIFALTALIGPLIVLLLFATGLYLTTYDQNERFWLNHLFHPYFEQARRMTRDALRKVRNKKREKILIKKQESFLLMKKKKKKKKKKKRKELKEKMKKSVVEEKRQPSIFPV